MAHSPGKKDPNLFEKIDFIIQFFMDPCDAPWTMYALAAGGAALEAFVSLFSLDVSDIFWNAFGGAFGLGRQRRGRKGGKGKKRGRGYDPNENIGKKLGDWAKVPGLKIPVGIGFLWITFGVLQRLLFWLFLAEVVVQFFFRWTSLMFESRYCRNERDLVVLRFQAQSTINGLFPPIPVPGNTILKQRGPVASLPGVVVIPNGFSGIMTASCSFTKTGGSPGGTFTITIANQTTGRILARESKPVFVGEEISFGLAAEFNSAGTYTATCNLTAGTGTLNGCYLYAQGSPQA